MCTIGSVTRGLCRLLYLLNKICALQKQRVSFSSRVFVLWRFHRKNVKEPWSCTVTSSNKVRFFILSIQYGGGFERVSFNQCAREATDAKEKRYDGAETVSSSAIASRISRTASLMVGLLKAFGSTDIIPSSAIFHIHSKLYLFSSDGSTTAFRSPAPSRGLICASQSTESGTASRVW